MAGSYLTNPLEFLINTLFSLYILAIMLRFLLARVRADFYNPLSQFLVRITDPLVIPLRRIIPSVGGNDLATLLLMAGLQLLAILLVSSLHGAHPGPGTLLVLTLIELLSLAINIFVFSILILAVLSWVSPGTYNPMTSALSSLTEPLLGPIRRRIPAIGGLDLSPLIAIIGLQLLKMVLIPPLMQLA